MIITIRNSNKPDFFTLHASISIYNGGIRNKQDITYAVTMTSAHFSSIWFEIRAYYNIDIPAGSIVQHQG
jgi:hypothetical protein